MWEMFAVYKDDTGRVVDRLTLEIELIDDGGLGCRALVLKVIKGKKKFIFQSLPLDNVVDRETDRISYYAKRIDLDEFEGR